MLSSALIRRLMATFLSSTTSLKMESGVRLVAIPCLRLPLQAIVEYFWDPYIAEDKAGLFSG